MPMMHEASPLQFEAHRRHKERQARIRASAHIAVSRTIELTQKQAPPQVVLTLWSPAAECAAWMAAERDVLIVERKLGYKLPPHVRAPAPVIIATVGKHFGISRVDLISQRRTKNIVLPRMIAMYLIKMLTGCSLPLIGRLLGDRDHTTALSGVRKIAKLRERDPFISESITALSALLAADGFDISPLSPMSQAEPMGAG